MWDYQYAKGLEREGKWEEAAKVWRQMGCKEDFIACKVISLSNQEGDRYRELAAPAMKKWEDREFNNEQLHEALNEAQRIASMGDIFAMAEQSYKILYQ